MQAGTSQSVKPRLGSQLLHEWYRLITYYATIPTGDDGTGSCSGGTGSWGLLLSDDTGSRISGFFCCDIGRK